MSSAPDQCAVSTLQRICTSKQHGDPHHVDQQHHRSGIPPTHHTIPYLFKSTLHTSSASKRFFSPPTPKGDRRHCFLKPALGVTELSTTYAT